MKKILLMSFLVFVLVAGASISQASYVEMDLPLYLPANVAGSVEIGIYLTDLGTLPNVDDFNLSLGVSGFAGLQMSKAYVKGPTIAGYIFSGKSFAFSVTNPGNDLTQLAVMDVTNDAVGVDLSSGNNLLALFTLAYPKLNPGTILSFSLNPSGSFADSDADSGAFSDALVLRGRTEIPVPNVPIPGAIWLLGSGVMSLVGLRRWSHRS